jgi:hypothetical protein
MLRQQQHQDTPQQEGGGAAPHVDLLLQLISAASCRQPIRQL